MERDTAGLENRKETKQEREARKLEKERAARERERERSMRDESVDGGFLVTQGVYTGLEDYNKPIVRQLMVRAWKPTRDYILMEARSRDVSPLSGGASMIIRSLGQNTS